MSVHNFHADFKSQTKSTPIALEQLKFFNGSLYRDAVSVASPKESLKNNIFLKMCSTNFQLWTIWPKKAKQLNIIFIVSII